MKFSIRLLFLFFIFSFNLYGQDSTSQIKDKWKIVKSLIQRRSNIITNLTTTLSKSNVDKRQNNNLKELAIDLHDYVASLNLTDSVSVSILAVKNKKLWQSLIVTLIEVDSHQEIKSKEKFATIQGELEGCKNLLKYKGRQGKFFLITIQHYYLKDEIGYALTFIIKDGKEKEYIPIADKIFNSFQLRQ